MNTPICDFAKQYANQHSLRLHMPAHKGESLIGAEPLDITEIAGADSLYQASGIIAESESNASTLFGCPTFYSTEGSSQCIRGMLHLACLQAKEQGKSPRIAAGRNAHSVFLSAAALLDFEVQWLYGEDEAYLSCKITPEGLEEVLKDPSVTAVYLTSPDYLGNRCDIAALSRVCRRHGVLLLVDNAHGAYLKFLSPSQHPMDLGADLCCASAHKTLPVLTGGAYLHVAKHHKTLINQAKSALELFGSTSPSYLILQSLDRANALCEKEFPKALQQAKNTVDALRSRLQAQGFCLIGDEPLKLTLAPKDYGYTGTQVADLLKKRNAVCEFADEDFVVMMLSPSQTAAACTALQTALSGLPKKEPLQACPPKASPHLQARSIRDAALGPREEIPVEQSAGRILAVPSIACPPAVPILVCGEQITPSDLPLFHYYGIDRVWVCR
ncbi:MAG: aminotransferase class I/II-fold pyridoxal phosphate-dependent enzyme [Clostridia bacterium]|nr:aminotransferase class I/II-fold pyridoxal phosphate-dependent enzyme [Clostridia bacterium]